jgi:hypothetical protein
MNYFYLTVTQEEANLSTTGNNHKVGVTLPNVFKVDWSLIIAL